jgi:hypothetical protein
MEINKCSCGCNGMQDRCKSKLNYMFLGNLETIKRMIDEMVQMDAAQVDEILKGGHDWAVDHIASSVDDIQEVYNFLKNSVAVPMKKENDAFAEDVILIKTFESFIYEAKKIDQDKDGDNDFIDAKIAQYIAGGMAREEAIKKANKFKKK